MNRTILALMVGFWIPLFTHSAQASEQVYYFHNDHLGTPQAMTDAAGRIVWTAEYHPFGKATVNQDPDGDGQIVVNNLRFPGQYYDAETGLHYNYHRDYDPATGRYLQPDPVGLDGGLNLYEYASDNPLSESDEYGLWSKPIHKKITFFCAGTAGCRKIGRELADLTAGVDDLPGAQLPAQSYWHAMTNGENPKGWPKDKADYNALFNDGINSCDLGKIRFALHALQDSFAPAHKGFQPWFAGDLYKHRSDLFWSADADRAYEATTYFIGLVKENCPCLCN